MIETLRKRLINRKSPARLHLIGVAGSGMSGLALMLMEMGHRVSGCDRVTSTETERLQSLGLAFSCPHSADAVADAEIVIYSSAIREDIRRWPPRASSISPACAGRNAWPPS